MKKFIFSALICLFLSLMIKNPVYATRSISIGSAKSSLFGDEEMTVTTASISGFTNGETIYIKGAFYQDGSSPNYFAYTKNGENWIKNSDTSANQRQVKIGDWDGNTVVKVDFSDSGYKGEGGYKFKLGFYYTTLTGSISSINWSANSLDVSISEPDPTATPTLFPTSTPTPTSVPTPTRTPTRSQTSATISSSVISTKQPTPEANVSGVPSDVFGMSTKSAQISGEPLPTKKASGSNASPKQYFPVVPFILVAGSLCLLACSALVFFKMRSQNKEG